ncbi:MAG TPA: hypothetical protein VHE55_01900 [Fimbriimonadaceae bacterium]|nr:hypothetical protein [Fimbriimonadaceae bacterium]
MDKCARTGTCMFTWHDGKSRYDEVAWDPRTVTSSEASRMAHLKLIQDPRATRVQVEFAGDRFVEAVREELQAA